jgi:hypothetical protein
MAWKWHGIVKLISHTRRAKDAESFYRPQLAAMHDFVECQFCSGGTQYRHLDRGWGKIPNHMLHKVREPGGDIIFNAEPLYTDIRDCTECTGRGVFLVLKEERKNER